MLLRDTPVAQLDDRFPGTQVGTIGSEALPAPDSLIIVVGRDAADLSREDGAEQVTQISITPPSECSGVAGCSLAVSIAGGLAERRRPFSLLRLTGVPLALLRRVVALEAAVPLLITAVVSAGAGLVTAALFLRAQVDQTLQPPGLTYYLLIAGGIIASLAVIASTLPLLERLT